MSKLIVLGNLNHFTFINSIVAANSKAIEIFGEALTSVFVIHSADSLAKLNAQTDWVEHLESEGISQGLLSHKVIKIEATKDSVEEFVDYIEIILNGILSKSTNLIVDLTNGTSLHKNLLSTTAYVLELGDQYVIDITKLTRLTNAREYLPLDILKACYVPVPDALQLDSVAYLNLTEIVRYKRLIEQRVERYVQIDAVASDGTFFKGNLAHSIYLKLLGDRNKDNVLYRKAVSSISANVEDLISILIDKFIIKESPKQERQRTLGQKLELIQSKIESKKPQYFDLEFFKKFNGFIRYLRNSSTHKETILTNLEKFKAELATSMSFPFIEFYTDVVYPILADVSSNEPLKKIKRLSNQAIDANDFFYFGLDGDDTGSILEELFLSSYDETEFKKMSHSISKAIDEIKKYVRNNFSKDAIVFAAGDDMLFKGSFNEQALHTLQQMYQRITSGFTCSIGYGKSLQEVYLALKFAKAEPGKNSIVGIEIV